MKITWELASICYGLWFGTFLEIWTKVNNFLRFSYLYRDQIFKSFQSKCYGSSHVEIRKVLEQAKNLYSNEKTFACFSQSSGKIKFQFTLTKKFLVKSSRDNLTINRILQTFQLWDIFVVLTFSNFLSSCSHYFPFLLSAPANILFTI